MIQLPVAAATSMCIVDLLPIRYGMLRLQLHIDEAMIGIFSKAVDFTFAMAATFECYNCEFLYAGVYTKQFLYDCISCELLLTL